MLTSFRILLVLCGLGKKKKKPANINPPPIKQGQYISSLHWISVSVSSFQDCAQKCDNYLFTSIRMVKSIIALMVLCLMSIFIALLAFTYGDQNFCSTTVQWCFPYLGVILPLHLKRFLCRFSRMTCKFCDSGLWESQHDPLSRYVINIKWLLHKPTFHKPYDELLCKGFCEITTSLVRFYTTFASVNGLSP